MRRGLSLIELLVVISIVGLIAALSIPALMAAREASRRATCLSNLHQLSLAIQSKIDSDRHLLENRFVFDSANVATKERLWISDVRLSLTGTNHGPSSSYFLCPSGYGVVRFPLTVPRFNSTETMASDDESGDYVSNGGLVTPRDIRRPLEPSSMRGGIAADLFGMESARPLSMVQGGFSNTLAMWESLGGVQIDTYPDSPKKFMTPLTTRVIQFLRSDVDPKKWVPIVNQETEHKYCHSTNGRLVGYLALFDPNFQPMKENQLQMLTYRFLNVSNRINGPFSLHTGVVPVAMMDGSTRVINVNADSTVIVNLTTIADDLPVTIE